MRETVPPSERIEQLERRVSQAETLVKVAGSISYDQPLNHVLAELAAHIVRETNAIASGAILMNYEDFSMAAFGAMNLPEGYVEGMVAARQASPSEMASLRGLVDSHRSWVVRNAPAFMRSDPIYARMGEIAREVTWDTVVACPFLRTGDVVGVVYLYYAPDVVVDDAEIAFAHAVAEQAAPVMQNAWLFSESERRRNELEALSRADAALHRSLRLDDVSQAMTDLAIDLLGADQSFFGSWDDDGITKVVAASGFDAATRERFERRFRELGPRRPAPGTTHEVALIEDADNDPRTDRELGAISNTKSVAAIPILANGELYGFFQIGYRERRRFSAADRRLFDTLASRAALAIQNAVLFEASTTQATELDAKVSQLEALARADAAMHESLQLDHVLKAMADLAVDLLGADNCIFGNWDADGRMTILASRGFDGETHARLEKRYREMARPRPDTIPETALIEDVNTHPRADAELARIANVKSVAALSVPVSGQLYGYFQIGYRQSHTFTDIDRRLFDQLAARVGLAIQNALSFESSVTQSRELDARVGQLEALHRADAALHESLRLQDVLQTMADLAVDLLGADKSILGTARDDGRPTIRAARGVSDAEIAVLNGVYSRQTPDRWTTEVPTIQFIEDVQASQIDAEVRELNVAASYAEVPIFVDGQPFAFFTVGYSARRQFSDDDRRLFDTLAARAGLAIQNALTYEQSNARADELAARTGQLEALRRADAALHRSLRLQDVYEAMVELAMDLAGADRSLLIAWNEDERLHAYAARGVGESELAALNEIYHNAGKDVFEGRIPEILVMEDVPNDPRMNSDVRAITPSRSTVDIPVVVNGELFGLFVISWTRPHVFTVDDQKLFEALATRTAMAVQNALLYEQIAAQAVELEAQIRQLEALRTIAANLTLDPAGSSVYDELAAQVVRATSALASAVIVLEEEGQPGARMLGTAGLPPGFAPAMNEAYALGAGATGDDGISAARPTVLPEGRHTSLADDRFARARETVADAEWDMLVSRPLIYQERRLGMLVAGYPPGWNVDDDEISFLAAIADQGAVAVANARLMEAASNLATVEERQRLARELHDSVSQALYGIALGARTARRRLGDSGDSLVVEAVEYVLSLAEAGLTETRALIFELIPESLANEGLAVAVKRQAAAIQARHQIPVHIDLGDEPDLPLKTKEAIYRIAQESLNNLAKHAKAENAYVTLVIADGVVRLEVRDDGAGFDPAGDFPGHLGLISMQERARRIGATCAIKSSPGKGATVTLTVPTG